MIGDSLMKNVLVATGLIFVGFFGFALYMHYDTKKFIESLPHPPATQREVSKQEKAPTPLERGTPENQVEQTLEEPLPVSDAHGNSHEHTDSHGHTHQHDSHVKSTAVVESDEYSEETVEEITSGEQLPPGVVAWKSVDPNGEIVIDREAFLAEYGNHPEART